MHATTFEVAPENEAYSIGVGKLVAKVANHTPWTIKCLTQSIVTKNLLRKSNIKDVSCHLFVEDGTAENLIGSAFVSRLFEAIGLK